MAVHCPLSVTTPVEFVRLVLNRHRLAEYHQAAPGDMKIPGRPATGRVTVKLSVASFQSHTTSGDGDACDRRQQ